MSVELKVGDRASTTATFSQEAVGKFANLTGDVNPLHLDADYAATTIFKRPIVHGFLVGSLLSKTIAMQLPGPGTIYLEQTMKFKAPVYIGDTVLAYVEVLSSPKPGIYVLKTWIENSDGKAVIEGQAIVKC